VTPEIELAEQLMSLLILFDILLMNGLFTVMHLHHLLPCHTLLPCAKVIFHHLDLTIFPGDLSGEPAIARTRVDQAEEE